MFDLLFLILISVFVPVIVFAGLKVYRVTDFRKITIGVSIAILAMEIIRFLCNAALYPEAETPKADIKFGYITVLVILILFATFRQSIPRRGRADGVRPHCLCHHAPIRLYQRTGRQCRWQGALYAGMRLRAHCGAAVRDGRETAVRHCRHLPRMRGDRDLRRNRCVYHLVLGNGGRVRPQLVSHMDRIPADGAPGLCR